MGNKIKHQYVNDNEVSWNVKCSVMERVKKTLNIQAANIDEAIDKVVEMYGDDLIEIDDIL